MIHTQNMKIVPVCFPQAIVDADDPVGAYGDTNPVSVNVAGWKRADVYAVVGATDIAMTAFAVYAGDVAASGADDADYALIPGAAASGSTGDGRLPQADDDNKVFHIGIDHPEQYGQYLAVDATCGDGSAGTFVTIFVVLSRGDETPSTLAGRGLAGSIAV